MNKSKVMRAYIDVVKIPYRIKKKKGTRQSISHYNDIG